MKSHPRSLGSAKVASSGIHNPTMKARIAVPLSTRALALGAAVILLAAAAQAEEIEAVSSRTSDDYVRQKLPNGTFKAEYYAFAKGGYWSGDRNDKTIDKMGFLDVARTIAAPLGSQNYIPAKDPKTTKLLIMVYWGTTEAPEHATDTAAFQNLKDDYQTLNQRWAPSKQHDRFGNSKLPPAGDLAAWQEFDEVTTDIAAVQAENRIRDQADRINALMLGYDSWWAATFDAQNGTALEVRKRDMLDELEEDRYFVVLLAYDFQMMWKEKKSKLLWETRFSVSEHHNEFDKQLESMAKYAAAYFGQDSHGLMHKPIPEGHVEVGDVRNLGVVPEKK